MKDLSFSINLNDDAGYIFKKCVLLYIDKNIILPFDTVDELEKFANDILHMIPEIKGD